MASLRKKSRSPYWFACFTLPDGSRTQRSTKIPALRTKEKDAQKIADHWEDAVKKRLTEAQARQVMSDIHEMVHGEKLSSPNLDTHISSWLELKKGEVAAATYSAYKLALNDFVKAMGDRGNQPMNYITPAHIAKWRDTAAQKATARTANNKLKAVKVFFQSAWNDSLVSDNPAVKVKSLKAPQGNRRPFEISEIKTILSVASFEWKGIILTGLYTGQRLNDIASLTWSNVDLERMEICLTSAKTARRQIIPIAKPLLDHLYECINSRAAAKPIFPEAHRLATRPGRVSSLSQQFHALLVSAGLVEARAPKHIGSGKGRSGSREQSTISFHSLRHTATSMLKNSGASEAVTRDLIGHESAEVSRHYTHTNEEAKRAAIDRLPDITV